MSILNISLALTISLLLAVRVFYLIRNDYLHDSISEPCSVLEDVRSATYMRTSSSSSDNIVNFTDGLAIVNAQMCSCTFDSSTIVNDYNNEAQAEKPPSKPTNSTEDESSEGSSFLTDSSDSYDSDEDSYEYSELSSD